MDLRAGLASVDRARTGQGSPLFARTDAPSSTARDQSIRPWLPNSSRTTRCNRRHRPVLVHSANRRCAVGTVTPNEGGNSRHGHPLVSTYTTAVNTARSSTGARPPPCGRTENDGINGSTKTHNSSGTNRRDNASTTTDDHAPPTTRSIRDTLLEVAARPGRNPWFDAGFCLYWPAILQMRGSRGISHHLGRNIWSRVCKSANRRDKTIDDRAAACPVRR